MIGFIPDNKLNYWFHASDIFILPSLRETFPIVMLESLACGTPVVGSRIAALPEVFYSDDYGLLVEPGNPKDLSDKILESLDKKWDYNSIKNYSNTYTWDNIKNDILDLYELVKV